MKEPIRYLSLCGLLGYGYSPVSLENALKEKLDFVGVDAGSTDPGPYYLGSGKGFVKKLQVKRDLSLILPHIKERNIPLVIGSAGGSGARPHVESVLEILGEIAKEQKTEFNVAVIYSDLDKDFMRRAADGHLFSCGGSPEFNADLVDKLENPVAQFGTDPIIEALKSGAEVIVSGRCCDTAVFASYPIWKGFDPGLALHAAKIAECGALCARPVGKHGRKKIRRKGAARYGKTRAPSAGSNAMIISAVSSAMSGENTSSPSFPMRTWETTEPPRCAIPIVSAVRTCQPFSCAAWASTFAARTVPCPPTPVSMTLSIRASFLLRFIAGLIGRSGAFLLLFLLLFAKASENRRHARRKVIARCAEFVLQCDGVDKMPFAKLEGLVAHLLARLHRLGAP